MTWSLHKRRPIPTRLRAACGLAVACLVAGCSSEGSDFSAIYAIARQTWGGGSQKVTLQQAAAVPYASIGVQLGDGPQIMLILAGDAKGTQLWTSASRIAITTRKGRIVSTAGLDHNLGGRIEDTGTQDSNGGTTIRWFADFPDLQLYSVRITCSDRPGGNQTITILGTPIRTRRIDESCAADESTLDWSFKNVYWIDPDSGLVWRSIQHIHPKLDAIETEVLRPPE